MINGWLPKPNPSMAMGRIIASLENLNWWLHHNNLQDPASMSNWLVPACPALSMSHPIASWQWIWAHPHCALQAQGWWGGRDNGTTADNNIAINIIDPSYSPPPPLPCINFVVTSLSQYVHHPAQWQDPSIGRDFNCPQSSLILPPHPHDSSCNCTTTVPDGIKGRNHWWWHKQLWRYSCFINDKSLRQIWCIDHSKWSRMLHFVWYWANIPSTARKYVSIFMEADIKGYTQWFAGK